MDIELYKIYFFIIHLANLFALVLHIGWKEDGFDVKTKRFSKQGKVATAIEISTIIAFAAFAFFYTDLGNLSSLYLGFGITVSIFSIPFLTTCHIKYSSSKVTLNFAGFVALLVGFSGFLTSFIWFFDSPHDGLVGTDMIDNYISILGQFIAGTSALIAFSGTTIEAKEIKNDKGKPIPITRLTDLGKVAIIVIILGFSVSIIDFNLENAEKERVNIEVDQILAQAQSISTNLDSSNTFLTQSLMPKTEHWLLEVNDKVKEIKALNDKLDTVKARLQEVAQAQELEVLHKQLEEHENHFKQLKREQRRLAKTSAIREFGKKIEAYQAELTTMKQRMNKLAQASELEQLQQSISRQQREIKTIQKTLSTLPSKQDISSLKKEVLKLQEMLKNRPNE